MRAPHHLQPQILCVCSVLKPQALDRHVSRNGLLCGMFIPCCVYSDGGEVGRRTGACADLLCCRLPPPAVQRAYWYFSVCGNVHRLLNLISLAILLSQVWD